MRKATLLILTISLLFFITCRKPENIKANFNVPDITYVENCNLVTFNNRSKAATDYIWDFGDGATSIEKNPSHLYEKTGTYTVSLMASNDEYDDETMEDVTISKAGTFEKISGSTFVHEEYNNLLVESDDNFVLAATLFTEVKLSKVNSTGTVEWEKSYGNFLSNSCNALIKTLDNGYLMAGCAIVSPEQGKDNYLVKTDTEKNLIWERTYGGPNDDVANAVVQTDDGNYIVVGYTNDDNNYNAYISKIDDAGSLLWERTIDIFGNDEAFAIANTNNNSFIISGGSLAIGADFNTGIFVLEIDNDGNVKWQRIYDNISFSNEIIVEGSSYIIAGHTDSFKNSDTDIYLIKINQFGDLEWEKTYPKTGEDKAYSIGKATDGGYVITGQSANEQRGDADAFLLKVDDEGNKMFYKTYGSGDFDTGSAVKATEDCGYLVAGYSKINPSNYLLLKTDSEGNL